MNKIQQLIAQGKTKEALEALPSNNEVIQLQGRLSALLRQEMLGTIDSSNARLERNNINQAVLSLAGVDVDAAQVKTTQMDNKSKLLSLSKELARIDPDNAQKAKELYKDLAGYYEEKALDDLYDVSGRLLKALNEDIESFLGSLHENNLDDKEDFATAIKMKLEATIPSWKEIESAYKLALGRGMKDSYIEDCIKAKVEDRRTKVNCADRITNWVSNYLKS